MTEQQKATTPSKPKHPGGRPTKLTKELVDFANTYIDKKHKTEVISEVGLALYIKVALSTVKLWGAKETALGKKFSATLRDVSDFQHHQLLNNGITGKWKPTIVELMLNNHGYAKKTKVDEKSDQTITVTTRFHEED